MIIGVPPRECLPPPPYPSGLPDRPRLDVAGRGSPGKPRDLFTAPVLGGGRARQDGRGDEEKSCRRSQFKFRTFERRLLIEELCRGFLAVSSFTRLGWPTREELPTQRSRPIGYLLFPRPATALRLDLRASTYQTFLVIVAGWRVLSHRATPLHHRGHLLRRQGRHRPLVAIPWLLRRRLGHRYLLPGLDQAGPDDPHGGPSSTRPSMTPSAPWLESLTLRRRHAL